jgi:hypothetical protein
MIWASSPKVETRDQLTAVRFRSPPCRYHGFRRRNRLDALTNRERSSQSRIGLPFPWVLVQPDGRNLGTRRSRVAPRRGGTTQSGEHAQPTRSRVSSAGRNRLSSSPTPARPRRFIMFLSAAGVRVSAPALSGARDAFGGSGRILARMPFSILMRGDSG